MICCYRKEAEETREEELNKKSIKQLLMLNDNLKYEVKKDILIQIILHMEESLNDGYAF